MAPVRAPSTSADMSICGMMSLSPMAAPPGAQGGQIFIEQFVDGGHAQFKLFGNSLLDISAYEATGLVTGSIEGEGTVFLGAKTLSVGRNHLDTVFSGIIRDGRGQRGPGSLHKIGHGTLTLTGANLYTGPTVVNGGKLLINNASGSGVGTGILQVNTGTLGGNGTIAGIVTVGTGSGFEAVLAPGANGANLGTLTVQSQIIFNSDATYRFGLNSNAGTSDHVAAVGITINNGAQFLPHDLGNATLEVGTVLTAIDNTAATPIVGTFANLPDGGIVTVNGNNLQASYSGGDGNDLTLTVVP